MNIKRISLRIATAASVLAASTLFAQMNHGDMGGMDMGHGAHQHDANAHAEHAPLPQPAQTVFAYYFKLQTRLAQDLLHTSQDFRAMQENALVIVTSIRHDSAKTFPDDIAQQAQTLAGAKDLKAAREAFKPLSESLIKYRDAHKEQAGQFVKVFCPMAKAVWLQTGSVVNNPYLGKEMARCGNIQS